MREGAASGKPYIVVFFALIFVAIALGLTSLFFGNMEVNYFAIAAITFLGVAFLAILAFIGIDLVKYARRED